jgi:deoxycytidine triphosphate deaminase
MSIQSGRWIREQSQKGMIVPFSEKQVREGAISYGLSSYVYDLRVSDEFVNVTPFEPEWEGFVTLEISNTTPLPARIYANEGLCQILFFRSDEPCEISYAHRKGKYQKQQGIVLPKL